jgi:hypothetical protein
MAPGQRVWLVIDNMPGLARVVLNAAEVGQVSSLSALPCPIRIEIAEFLKPRNELTLEVVGEQTFGEVRLEIE